MSSCRGDVRFGGRADIGVSVRVTIEGVETAAQAAFLDSVDGDQAQGYFFGRPVPASDVGAHILADFQARHLAPPSAQALEGKQRLGQVVG